MPKRRMCEDAQSLYPEAIYSLHRVLDDIWDSIIYPEGSDRETEPIVMPSMFSRHSRSFHWLAVGRSRWGFNDDFSLTDLRQAVEVSVEGASKHPNALQNDVSPQKFHHQMLVRYTEFHIPPRLYLDGIIYRTLEHLHKGSRSTRISVAQGQLLLDLAGTYDQENGAPWVRLTMNDGAQALDVDPYHCQERVKSEQCEKNIQNTETRISTSPEWETQNKLRDEFFLKAIFGSEGKAEGAARPKEMLLVPFYDVCLDNKPWGNLWGNLLLLFHSNKDSSEDLKHCNSFVTKKLDEVIRESRKFSDELGRSAIARILAQPLWDGDAGRSYDLVEHFVRQIIWLQDWEWIIVYQKKGDSTCEPLYCYQRVTNGDGIRMDWERCPHKSDKDYFDCQTKQRENTGGCLRWEQNLCLWDKAFLPDLSDEERSMYEGIHLACEYPLSAVIPSDLQLRKALDDYYIRQQIEVLRGLAPKIRARRSALRTAAVTIMSRNMSHNIGSHVLAGMSSEQTIGLETSKALSELINGLQKPSADVIKSSENLSKSISALTKNLSQFIHYLQERMDFIADVATSSPLASLSQYIVRDTLWPLTQQAILLKTISGVRKDGNPVEARLNVCCNGILLCCGALNQSEIGTADIRFGCPGGRMGAHAFYVILENIIRNTAKHSGTGADNCVTLSVNVSDTHSTESERDAMSHLIRVDIWDDRGMAWKKENGRSIKDNISAALQEAIIEEDGEIRSGNWGIREMLICAAYLRRCRLQELEQEFSPPLLQVLAVDNDGKEVNNGQTAHLCYRFYVERAKDLVVLSDEENLWGIDKGRRSILRRHGVEIVSGAHEVSAVLARGLDHAMAVWLTPPEAVPEAISGADLVTLPVRIFVPEAKVSRVAGALPLSSAMLGKVEKLKTAGSEDAILPCLVELWQLRCERSFSVQSLAVLSQTDEQGEIRPLWGNGAAGRGLNGSVQKVIYDHHGVLHGDGGRCSAHTQCSPTHAELQNDIAFWEPYQQAEPIHTVINYRPMAGASRDIVKWQLVEAGLTTVAVVDERVQRQAYEEERRYGKTGAETTFRLMTVLSNMNVWVPSKDFAGADLDAPNIDAIETWLDRLPTKPRQKRLDFLVIHQGILDRLKDQLTAQGKTAEQWLEELTECHRISSLVVCSGRGRPAGLPAQARFAPVSSVLKWVVQSKSKYHLCQTLYASRRAHHG